MSPPPAFAQGVAPTRAFVVVAGPGVARYEGTDKTFNVGVGGEVVWPRGPGVGADFTVATSRLASTRRWAIDSVYGMRFAITRSRMFTLRSSLSGS